MFVAPFAVGREEVGPIAAGRSASGIFTSRLYAPPAYVRPSLSDAVEKTCMPGAVTAP